MNETRAAFEPRAKFSFKTKKNASAISLSDAAALAAEGRRSIPGYRSPGASSVSSSANNTPNYPSTPLNEPDKQHQERPEIAPTSFPTTSDRDMESKAPAQGMTSHAFAAQGISNVSVDDHYGLHIMLPASGSTSTVPASITSLRHCVVDMSIPTADGKPYASLTVKNIEESLLICGQVNGPAHITGLDHSVIVVSCRQFRMHGCKDVDVYLSCSSNPIIEDCSNIRFTRIPKAYVCCTPTSALSTLYTNRISRHWTMIALTMKIDGVRWRILNGSNQNLAQIGVSWMQAMRFPRKSGRKLFPAGRAGLSMIFCMPSSW